MTNIDKLVAIEKAQGVDLEFLGHLVWYSVTECSIQEDELKGIFERAELDEKYFPKAINVRDAFRRATKFGEHFGIDLGNGKTLNILVRDVGQGPETVTKQLVREVVDTKNERLEYKPVVMLRLNKDAFTLAVLDDLYVEEQDAARRVEKAFEREKDHYNDRTCRDILTSVLRGCQPVSVRPSGGVIFTPAAYEKEVEALQRFANEISEYATRPGYKSRVYRIPVVNADEQRTMLEESLEDQVKSETSKAIAEMTELIKSGKKVSYTVANHYIDRAKAAGALVKSYEEMLNVSMTNAQADLEVIMAQALQVLEKAE